MSGPGPLGLLYMLGGGSPLPPPEPDANTWLPGSSVSAIYPLILNAFLTGEIVNYDLFGAQAVDGRVLFDSAHQFLDDLDPAGFLGTHVQFPEDDIDGTVVRMAPATFVRFNSTLGYIETPDTTNAPAARALIITYGDGTPATTRLVAYLGRKIDSRQVNDTTNDGGMRWAFPDYIFSI